MPRQFYLETLGCPKNQVDSDKIVGTLLADGMTAADSAADADLVIVNTCAFIEEARQESIDTILSLSAVKRDGARVVVTGCMAERYGDELAAALPEVDAVSGFGVPVTLTTQAAPRARVRSPQLAAAPGVGSLGVREDRRGLRPHLWVLRDPQLPRSSAQPHAGVDPRRGRAARCPGDRARGAGPRLIRERRR